MEFYDDQRYDMTCCGTSIKAIRVIFDVSKAFLVFVEVLELTVGRANLVAHGVANQMVLRIKHYKYLVNTELLGRLFCTRCHIMWTALKGDGLTPLVASGLNFAVRGDDGIVTTGGGSDHWEKEQMYKCISLTLKRLNFVCN